MQRNRLYYELAHLWPLISPPEEYADDARHWHQALREKLGPGRHRILELGVGGGHNLYHLTPHFQATAVDLSEPMLALSRQLNPEVEHHVGDMRTIRLGRRFRAVLVHDAICYMLIEDDLRATFATARAHLVTGGVLIVSPDCFRETFKGTSVIHWTRRKGGLELTCVEYLHDPDPSDTIIESIFFYILAEGGKVEIEQDRHITGLFSLNTWLRLMEEAGFRVEVKRYPAYEAGYGGYLLVGTAK